ncbi:MAG TPA: ACP S-malonyltransferase, partial [Bdellovibrionota bacterium]|nr:ACP S-malonyltransferase [Bdellovibrionota bacterium]
MRGKKIAFLFPGQGSQVVGMGKALSEKYGIAASTFEEANEVLGFDLRAICFEGPEETLQLTENLQPALLTTSVAVWRSLQKETSIEPAFVAGHSLGEYSALVAAGALAFEDAVRLTRIRGQAMQEAVPVGKGAMSAILGLSPKKVTELCLEVSSEEESVVPANLNSSIQTVVSGHAVAVE